VTAAAPTALGGTALGGTALGGTALGGTALGGTALGGTAGALATGSVVDVTPGWVTTAASREHAVLTPKANTAWIVNAVPARPGLGANKRGLPTLGCKVIVELDDGLIQHIFQLGVMTGRARAAGNRLIGAAPAV
jgi:hypothetical protein